MINAEKSDENIILLAGIGAALSFTGNFFIILSYSLFLKNIGVHYIPYYYIIFNAISICLGLYLLMSNFSSTRGLIISNLTIALVFTTRALCFSAGSRSAIFVVYVMSTLYYIYSVIFFWNHINSRFSIRSLKKHTGIFAAAIFAGTISSGFLIKPCLTLWSEKICFLTAAFISVALAILIKYYTLREKKEAAPARHSQQALFPRELFNIEIIRIMALFTLLFVFIRYLVDYKFSGAVASHFPDSRSLSGFMGTFTASIYICIFIWQTCFLHRVLKKFSVASLYTFICIVFLLIAVVCTFYGGLTTIAVFQASVLLLLKTIRQPSQNVLVKAVSPDIRSGTNFLLCGIVESSSVMFSGFVIVVLNALSSFNALFSALTLAASLTAILLTSKMSRSYLDLLILNLKSEKPGLVYPYSSAAEFNPAALLGADSKENSEGIALLLRTEQDPEILQSLIKTVAGLKKNRLHQAEILRILRESSDPGVLCQCIETLAVQRASENAREILPHLASKNPWIKASAIMFLIRLSNEYPHNEEAIRELYGMTVSGDSHARAIAASIQGELGLECFRDSLMRLLGDRDLKVRKRAVLATLKLRSLTLLPMLREMSANPDNAAIHQLIAGVISRMNDALYDGIMTLTAGLSHGDRQRIRSSLHHLEKEEALEPIFRALRVLTPPLSTSIAAAIGEHERDVALMQLMNRCFKGDSFSFSPLIWDYISDDRAALTEPIFLNIRGSNGEELFRHEFHEITQTITGGQSDAKMVKRLLYLGLAMHHSQEDAGLIYEHMISGGKKEDLSSELLDSSVKDRVMKESFEQLLRSVRDN